MNDELTTIKVLALVIAAYPQQRDMTDTMLDIYCEALADIPPETLKAAALKHINDNKWFPTVAELRKAAQMVDDGSGFIPVPVVESDYWSAMSIIKGGLTGVIPAEAAHTDKRVAGILNRSRQFNPAIDAQPETDVWLEQNARERLALIAQGIYE